MERTLGIVKPDAVQAKATGKIIDAYLEAGLRIVGMKMVHLTTEQARGFYYVHKERPFFNDLVAFMTEGPVVLLCLEGENAIQRNRELMGATNPANASDGTLRKRFGANIERNAVHGSDAPETAAFEIGYFFNAFELV